MTSSDIRQAFLDFFRSKGHDVVASASVVAKEDPSLLFTNAGMNPFKPIFLGQDTDLDSTRAVNSEPCIRVSGKHNDLEDVGYDGTHLTSFEMLGNWSFGDYYKEDAIQWAWSFMTDVLELDPKRLYVTVYETDDESFELWRDHTTIDEAHIQRHGDKDNFWEMGKTGPCGPCSEIHFDLGTAHFPGLAHEDEGRGVNTDSGRYVELWNLVFIQYNRLADGGLEDLPKRHVDTGAGLERLASILDGRYSNYETDGFRPLIQQIESISGRPYDRGEAGVAHRVISDHIRTLCWTIAEHVVPSNEGAGYVVRRLLRRALRYGQKLGLNEPFLYRLVGPFAEVMRTAYPHVLDQQTFIENVVRAEEQTFLNTLAQGVSVLKGLLDDVLAGSGTVLSAEDTFKLYDTFGFPFDLTALIARERGVGLDTVGFDRLLEEQRERSREATRFQVAEFESSGVGPVVDASLHPGVYVHRPGGGELKISESELESVQMARHHTVTHLLHAALERRLGAHVKQSGSLVDPHYLRFDFTHFEKVSPAVLAEIEADVNACIARDVTVEVSETSLAEAKAAGIKALFGEKYGDRVRVVRIGDESVELCGGTHVRRTGQIERFRIRLETAVATGVRRIEALAGVDEVAAFDQQKVDGLRGQCLQKWDTLMAQAKGEALSVSFDRDAIQTMQREDLDRVFPQLVQESKRLAKHQAQKTSHSAGEWVATLRDQIEMLHDDKLALLTAVVEGVDMKTLRILADNLVDIQPNLVAVLVGVVQDQSAVLVKLGGEVEDELDASTILKRLIHHTGGRGGGRRDMAQGGNLDVTRCDTAFEDVRVLLT